MITGDSDEELVSPMSNLSLETQHNNYGAGSRHDVINPEVDRGDDDAESPGLPSGSLEGQIGDAARPNFSEVIAEAVREIITRYNAPSDDEDHNQQPF